MRTKSKPIESNNTQIQVIITYPEHTPRNFQEKINKIYDILTLSQKGVDNIA